MVASVSIVLCSHSDFFFFTAKSVRGSMKKQRNKKNTQISKLSFDGMPQSHRRFVQS